ncbi:hypothetical protein SISNIDRAFT_461923 [Sistotremastrum niveocremeum HHB9708]|uniref:Uncharacterized protein n=1 Tax=Sistotremastrum niveocremeum HHB9708 TaxID=1314777 RepID=A0A165AHE2_9AGAM|nr:hypothetical protein SISNIDRAFT_461923 [Sistotremastrum niveocremeum HHB9708]
MSLNRANNPFPSLDAPTLANPSAEDLESWVDSPAFDANCQMKAQELRKALDRPNVWDDEASTLFSPSDTVAPPTATEVNFGVSPLEAAFYYAGLNLKGLWPRLICRDSPDVFIPPTGPNEYFREMRLENVSDNHQWGNNRNSVWNQVRDYTAELLIKEKICVSSVDFVAFSILHYAEGRELTPEAEEEARSDDEVVEDPTEVQDNSDDDEALDEAYAALPVAKKKEEGKREYTDATVWIGILADTLDYARALEILGRIRSFISNVSSVKVNIAFRESMAQPLVTQALYPPAEFGDYLREFIDNVSVALSLPIAGRRTDMQGTMGPYFQWNDDLYALTARHNLFLSNDGNTEYIYHRELNLFIRDSNHLDGFADDREVVLMGENAFEAYKTAIQARISNLNDIVKALDLRIASLQQRIENGINVDEAQAKLTELQAKHLKTKNMIKALKKFFVILSRKWADLKDRVIGYVVWAPPIACGVGDNKYTVDLCVVKLNKRRFSKFIGNVLSLGPELSETTLKELMYERIDVPSGFKYPKDGLLELSGMVTADDIENPNSLDGRGDRTRRVLKRGWKTNTTVGNLPRFMSFVRKYYISGTLESLELAILPHESQIGPFSRSGDSGAVIVSAIGEYIGVLTGGTNKGTDGTDITYATLFIYIWALILAKFPGANLCFEDIKAFLATN